MIARRAVPLAAVPAVAIAAGLFVAATIAASPNSVEGFKLGAGLLGAVGLACVAVMARPAWTLSLGLALSVFNTHWSNMGVPFSVDRVFLVAGVASVVVREVRAGGWRRLRTEPVHWLLAVAALYAVVSAVLVGTVGDHSAQAGLLGRLGIIPYLLFFVAPFAFREERDRRVLLGTLVALGAYLGVTALLETTGPKALVVPGYITDPNVGIHFGRARGPLVEASGNGFVLFACLIACVMAFGTWRSRRWRQVSVAIAALCTLGVLFTVTRSTWLAAGIGAVAAMLVTPSTRRLLVPSAAIAALCALGVLFTVTRSTWLAAGIGAVAAMLVTPSTRRLLVPSAAIAALLVAGAFATIPGLSGKADSRANSQQPVWDRENSDAAAGRMIDAHPLFGFGWGRFGSDSPDYYVMNPNYPLTGTLDLHNVFLSNAVELGLLGTLLWLLALLAGVLGSILRRGPPELGPWRVGLVALFVAWLVIANTTPMSLAMPTLLLWMWAGVARGRQVEPERSASYDAARVIGPAGRPRAEWSAAGS
jgi:putative inorganic carbon (hco3(-)) transporter